MNVQVHDWVPHVISLSSNEIMDKNPDKKNVDQVEPIGYFVQSTFFVKLEPTHIQRMALED